MLPNMLQGRFPFEATALAVSRPQMRPGVFSFSIPVSLTPIS
jgi:hypothetical protein